jgi:ribosomal protein S21
MKNKSEQKQHLIDIMKGDEELGLYNNNFDSALDSFKKSLNEKYDKSQEIKLEDVFNDEKREGVKRIIDQHKVLKNLSLVNPVHLEMTSNGHGEFPDGYKLTEKGIQYIIEQLNRDGE